MRAKENSHNTITSFNIRHEERSEAVNAALIDFGSDHSFDEAAIIFARHYKFKISDSTIRRVTEHMGVVGEDFIKNKLAQYNKDEEEGGVIGSPLKTIFLGFDGCVIRTGMLEKIEAVDSFETLKVTSSIIPDLKKMISPLESPVQEPGVTPSGRVRCRRVETWKDVRLGYAKQGPEEESEKWFVGGLKSFPDLMKELFSLSLGLGMNEDTKPVATSDGGNGLYETLDETFCDLQFILDLYHFKEHLFEAAKDLGLGEKERNQWVSLKLTLAWKGQIESLIKVLEKEYKKTENEKIRLLIGYVKRFSKCLHYESYRDQGFPIGSGEIESAHKYITQKRLKLGGACWRPEHINPMLALRLIKTNDWWDEFLAYCHEIAA